MAMWMLIAVSIIAAVELWVAIGIFALVQTIMKGVTPEDSKAVFAFVAFWPFYVWIVNRNMKNG